MKNKLFSIFNLHNYLRKEEISYIFHLFNQTVHFFRKLDDEEDIETKATYHHQCAYQIMFHPFHRLIITGRSVDRNNMPDIMQRFLKGNVLPLKNIYGIIIIPPDGYKILLFRGRYADPVDDLCR